MKKLLLTIAILISFTSAIAKNENINNSINEAQHHDSLNKAPANSGIHEVLFGKNHNEFQQCMSSCSYDYMFCTSNAGWWNEWIYCERVMDRCEARCEGW